MGGESITEVTNGPRDDVGVTTFGLLTSSESGQPLHRRRRLKMSRLYPSDSHKSNGDFVPSHLLSKQPLIYRRVLEYSD